MTLNSYCRLKIWLLSLVLLAQIPCQSSQSRQESEDSIFQKGMAFPTWRAEQYCGASSDQSLRILAQSTCTEYVQLVSTWYQEHRFSNAMHPEYTGNTAQMECLRHAIHTAQTLGLRVMLKPHVDGANGDWRGTFQPENPEIWFLNYSEMVMTFAQLAQEEHVDILSIGCEFVELTTPGYTQAWKELTQKVKNVYDGPLIYAANWGRESQQIEFWDVLDFIGIDAYFELTEKIDPSLDELLAAWTPHVSEIESLYQAWQKPIVITEIGYRSLDGANRRPWDWEASGVVDLAEQSLCYQAVIQVFGEKPWFDGIYWWNWEPDPLLGGTTDNGYTPQGKPAEAIIKRWYCGDNMRKKGNIRR
jgi:hypothetical protein